MADADARNVAQSPSSCGSREERRTVCPTVCPPGPILGRPYAVVGQPGATFFAILLDCPLQWSNGLEEANVIRRGIRRIPPAGTALFEGVTLLMLRSLRRTQERR